jgi:predicted DNA-binding transcriptional regulator YafY
MATRTTVLRNTGVLAQAAAQGKTVTFTYTDAAGKTSKRRVTVQAAEKTRHNPDAVIVRGVENLNVRSFRSDRVLRARIVD